MRSRRGLITRVVENIQRVQICDFLFYSSSLGISPFAALVLALSRLLLKVSLSLGCAARDSAPETPAVDRSSAAAEPASPAWANSGCASVCFFNASSQVAYRMLVFIQSRFVFEEGMKSYLDLICVCE